jgi:release factor glutamine methyltransferase
MTTILDVLEKGAAFLSSKGIDEARLNMEHLVAHQLNCQRMDLYLRFDQPLSSTDLCSLRELLKKRSQNTPLQHLTGVVHFYSHKFTSDSRALIPRPETEELVALVLQKKFPRPARILDLGCGSGVIGISLAKSLGTDCEELVMADLSVEALSLTRENLASLEIEATLVESDLFSSVEGTFDLIITNLPYIGERERSNLSPEVLQDPEMALFSGSDGLDLIRIFCEQVVNYLNPDALVALEVGHQQGDSVKELLLKGGLINAQVITDLSGVPRFPVARK